MTVTIQDKRYILSQGQDNNMVYISEDNNEPVKRYFATSQAHYNKYLLPLKDTLVLWGSVIKEENLAETQGDTNVNDGILTFMVIGYSIDVNG